MKYLQHINSPADIKKLAPKQLCSLSEEMREFLIESVSKTGGHLSSNLGTIDLTLALHKVFDSPKDALIWDVGHQCYAHKMITGRKNDFVNLRKMGGLSGFPNPKESEHDLFVSGHGNTSLSVAIGIASAKKIKKEPGKVIAIVGDGAFTGGMIYEGMNNIQHLDNLIVILNDNEMSISKNVGSLSRYFTALRGNLTYFKVKRQVGKMLSYVPVAGDLAARSIQASKSAFRRLIYHSTMFEEMGFHYAGLVDGHNIDDMCTLFSNYKKEQPAPLFVHLITKKGKGFEPAEQNPGEFHGVSAFDANHWQEPDSSIESSFSTVFGKALSAHACDNNRLCAITAAMKYGTGLQYFYKEHKSRFFDVGMAEQHAVTFAAGLAQQDMQPVVALYSTFLQRGYDQLIHDVQLMHANVLFAIDRAGFVPADGATHQGIFDVAFLTQLPSMKVVSPCNYAELTGWLATLINEQGPRALRYPRGAELDALKDIPYTGRAYDYFPAQEKAKVAFVTYGAQMAETLEAAHLAQQEKLPVDVYKLCVVHPLPAQLVTDLLQYDCVLFVEEGIQSGGIGEHMARALLEKQFTGKYLHLAANIEHVTHATVEQLRTIAGLDSKHIVARLKEDYFEN